MAGKREQNQKSLDNLVQFDSESGAAAGRKGGVASGVAKRKAKTFRESVKAIMECTVQDEDKRKALEAMGLEPTMLNQIQHAVFDRAARGDVEAARYLRDTAGEKPREGLDLDIHDKPIASLDLSKMSDAELQQMAAQRAEED